jgi:hypothetical protein
MHKKINRDFRLAQTPVVQRYENARARKRYYHDATEMKLMNFLYVKRIETNSLAKEFYFPTIHPVACRGDVLYWRLVLLELLKTERSILEIIESLKKIPLAKFELPNVREETIFLDFVLEELVSLKEKGELSVSGKCVSTVPYAQKSPTDVHVTTLPRNAMLNLIYK